MKFFKLYIGDLFFSKRFYWALGALISLFIIAYSIPLLFVLARILTVVFFLLVILDYLVLFSSKGLMAERYIPERLSNGDENQINISIKNNFTFTCKLWIIDELPVQFQKRDFSLTSVITGRTTQELNYKVRPVERGEYTFYDLNVFASTRVGLVVRKFKFSLTHKVKVYPSFHAVRKTDLVAHSNNLSEAGNRKIRKIGQSVEFEQIREYVTGDDIRTLNWKATARKGGLMVNNYTDERSQQVYCFIDKGRVMKMPFNGMALLDYAINASLILSRVALLRQDRAGLVTFADTIGAVLPATRKAGQMNTIVESLYNLKTDFGETSFEKIYSLVKTRITQRSLIVLFTNFESLSGLERQLPYIRSIARTHLLLVVFFENTELRQLTSAAVTDIETLYIRTIAEKFAHEKQVMIRELQKYGILTIFTAPENLTISTVNKYLELKARQAI